MSGPLRQRLSALVDEHELSREAISPLRELLRRFEEDPTAPTTVTDPLVGVDVHIADALDGLRLPVVRGARRIADLGAGAGIPGLVLALALPAAHVTLVDSVGKKCVFMNEASAAMRLTNATAVAVRAEDWTDGRGVHDLVTARALAHLNVLIEYAAPLLEEGGHLVAWKGERDPAAEADGEAAAAEMGMALVDVLPVPPRPGADHHHLHVYSKVSSTPPKYPRRAGMASKRPLRASTAA